MNEYNSNNEYNANNENDVNNEYNDMNENESVTNNDTYRIPTINISANDTNESLRNRIRQTIPELIEITLLNNGTRIFNHSFRDGDNGEDVEMEDVIISTNLQTLREKTEISVYKDLDTIYEKCSICREDFNELDICRKINDCGHLFHVNCIDTWLETNVKCPICRHDLRTVSTDL